MIRYGCLGGTEARKRKSEGKRNFNNTLKLSVSEQAHRKNALAEVSWPTAVAPNKGEVAGVLRCTACLILMGMGVFLRKR